MLVQVTHNDLDGYGASTVVSSAVGVDRIVHVTRYADVCPALESEFERLASAPEPVEILVSDIAVEAGFAALASRFDRDHAGGRHRLTVIDHHASSLPSLEQAGLSARDGQGMTVFWDASSVKAFVDTRTSATAICAGGVRSLAARHGASPRPVTPDVLGALVGAVDAVDLWRRDHPAFPAGEAVNEAFWEVVQTYVPAGHPDHDGFVGGILLDLAAVIAAGGGAREVEDASVGAKRSAVDKLVRASGTVEDTAQAAMTTRMRAARVVAGSPDLFAEPFEGLRLKVAHALDPGVFQRASDFILDAGDAEVVANVMRGGAMSFRSRQGQALEMAARFGGGGHRDSAGARLDVPAVFDLPQAVAAMVPVLGRAVTIR